MNPIKRRSFLALLGLGAWASKKIVEASLEPSKTEGIVDSIMGKHDGGRKSALEVHELGNRASMSLGVPRHLRDIEPIGQWPNSFIS